MDGDVWRIALPERLGVTVSEEAKRWNDLSPSDWREAILDTKESGLSLLPARRIRRGEEIPSLQPILAEATEFDWVLGDTPAIGAVERGVNLTEHCDGCVLVLSPHASQDLMSRPSDARPLRL